MISFWINENFGFGSFLFNVVRKFNWLIWNWLQFFDFLSEFDLKGVWTGLIWNKFFFGVVEELNTEGAGLDSFISVLLVWNIIFLFN